MNQPLESSANPYGSHEFWSNPPEDQYLETSSLTSNKSTSQRERLLSPVSRYSLHNGWNLEIGSVILSFIAIVLLIGFLVKINNTPYASWQYSIAPNTVLSIIITASKGAILVPVSSCLGQLKWNQYRKSTPLYNIQVIDQASRGAWGSLQLLGRGLGWSRIDGLILSWAVIMVLTLAIDPFAQQILAFPLNTVYVTNATASVQATHAYISSETSASVTEQETYELDTPMIAAIMSGLVQKNNPLEPSCNATSCTFPEFITMGVCNNCANVTAQTNQKCQYGPALVTEPSWFNQSATNCTYTTPSGLSVTLSLDEISLQTYPGAASSVIGFGLQYWATVTQSVISPVLGIQSPITSLLAVDYQDASIYYSAENVTAMMPKPSLTECVIYFCEKQYSQSSYVLTNKASYAANISKTQPLNGAAEGNDALMVSFNPPSSNTTLSKNSSYYMDYATFIHLGETLEDLLKTSFLGITNDDDPVSADLAMALHTNGIGPSIESLSDSLTDTMRENSQAYAVPGEAYDVETYIAVRWPWIILPLCVVLGTIILLLGTMLVSKQDNAILWKSSVIPLLVAELEAGTDRDNLVSLRNVDDMNRVSQKLVYTLDQDRGLFLSAHTVTDNPEGYVLQSLDS